MNYTNEKWYLSDDFDGEIKASRNGEECVIVDQYWSTRKYELSDEEQLGNIALIIHAPILYETLKKIKEINTDYHIECIINEELKSIEQTYISLIDKYKEEQ